MLPILAFGPLTLGQMSFEQMSQFLTPVRLTVTASTSVASADFLPPMEASEAAKKVPTWSASSSTEAGIRTGNFPSFASATLNAK